MADEDPDTGAADQQAADDTADSKAAKDDKAKDDKKPDEKKPDEKKPDEKKDSEQERRDRFKEASGDPFEDAMGGGSARGAESQAYQSWIRTVRASGAAAFVGGGHIGVLNITTVSGAADRRGQAPGPVRGEVIAELTDRYALVPGYETLVKQLADTRLLVLRGAPRTGRTTTGLRLLAKLTDTVARFGPDTDLRTLTAAQLEPETGFLQDLSLDLSLGPHSQLPTPDQVDQLRDCLAERGCYLVLVAPHDVRYRDSFDGCIADCPLPDPREVFRRAIECELRRRPGQEEPLRQLAANAEPDGTAGPRTPAEVHWLVAHVLSTAAIADAATDVSVLNSDLASRYVSAWFEPLAGLPVTSEGDEPIRLAAFRISLAVLNDSPFDLVAEAAEDLTERILIARSPRRTPGRPVFARHREDYVANSLASVRPGWVKFITVAAPASLVAYDDDRLPLAVLRHVWAVHNLREPLLSWLEHLSDDRRPLVYMRAVLAIGLLTAWDFSYTFHERIAPWASSAEAPRRRRAAAIALDEASRNDDVRPVVSEILDDWCEQGTSELRWTGAMALSRDLGMRDLDNTLKELRKLGCWKDGKLVKEASWAVARLFALGGIQPVTKTLGDWLDDDRLGVRWLGLIAVWRIADIRINKLEEVFELSAASVGGGWTRLAERGRWPLLVALADEDPSLLDPFADLVWQLTRSVRTEQAAAATLKRWMRAGKRDPTCIGPIGRFLALLGDDDSDRARLLHIVRSLRRDRDRPLPAIIADRFERAIQYNIHTMDE